MKEFGLPTRQTDRTASFNKRVARHITLSFPNMADHVRLLPLLCTGTSAGPSRPPPRSGSESPPSPFPSCSPSAAASDRGLAVESVSQEVSQSVGKSGGPAVHHLPQSQRPSRGSSSVLCPSNKLKVVAKSVVRSVGRWVVSRCVGRMK
eukprot:Selendium_serpulae@DN2870_c0_g1_i2.p1